MDAKFGFRSLLEKDSLGPIPWLSSPYPVDKNCGFFEIQQTKSYL
jgi:hypothetical protein